MAVPVRPSPASALYEQDFHAWSRQQAQALRERRFSALDLPNLLDEVEDLGRNEQRALESHLEVLIAHLLKCMVQPERRTRSWDLTIAAQRRQTEALLQRNPSLNKLPTERLAEIYAFAVHLAVRDTALFEDAFPAECPFTVEQILDAAFDPGRSGE